MKVRDLIKKIEDDGWKLARTHHPTKPDTVTIAPVIEALKPHPELLTAF